ncbi:hypothetical protein BGX31_002826, partial [Mortierella sp. GBA43]
MQTTGAPTGEGSQTVTHRDVAWFEDSEDRSPVAFFNTFSIFSKEDGHDRYGRLLRLSTMSKQERAISISNFDTWKKTEGLIFWERRKAKLAAKKSAWRTAGALIEGSEVFASSILAENSKEQEQHTTIAGSNTGQASSIPQDPVDDVQQLEARPNKRRTQGAADKGRQKRTRTNKSTQEEDVKTAQQRRTERFDCLEKDRFWVLRSSGRTVEHVLFEAGLKDGASV